MELNRRELLRTARLTNPCFWLSAVSYRLSARKDRVIACAGINRKRRDDAGLGRRRA
jgi:hypothetical protein